MSTAHSRDDNTYGLPEGDDIARVLRRFFALQAEDVLAQLARSGLDAPAPSLAAYDADMADAMNPLLASYWDAAGKSTYGVLGLDPHSWRVTDPHVADAIDRAALAFCETTNQTTSKAIGEALADLRRELKTGIVDHGESLDQLTKRVKSIFTEASDDRARMIAASEASRAVHMAQLESARESGVVSGARWLLSSDACPQCHRIAATAGTVPLGADFAVIGDHPVYKNIKHPPGHPACQCSLELVLIESLADGSAAVQPDEALAA